MYVCMYMYDVHYIVIVIVNSKSISISKSTIS
jgi:hypothetical protein